VSITINKDQLRHGLVVLDHHPGRCDGREGLDNNALLTCPPDLAVAHGLRPLCFISHIYTFPRYSETLALHPGKHTTHAEERIRQLDPSAESGFSRHCGLMCYRPIDTTWKPRESHEANTRPTQHLTPPQWQARYFYAHIART
jgi:hypothetical protein